MPFLPFNSPNELVFSLQKIWHAIWRDYDKEITQHSMLLKNLQLAVRHLFKDKQGNFIHLLGLSVGIAGFMFLLQYVLFEKSYDRFHDRSEDLYRVTADIYQHGQLNVSSATTYLALSPALKRDFQEVENYTRFLPADALITIGDQRFREEQLFFADGGFFDLFSIPVLDGDPARALTDPNSVVLSESAAIRFFGDVNCVGKNMEVENWTGDRLFTVTAVMEDIPINAHLQSDVFLSMATLLQTPGTLSEWGWRDFYNYLLLRPGTAEDLEQKIQATDYVGEQFERYVQLGRRHDLQLQPVEDIHLYSDLSLELGTNGNGRSINLLMVIGFFILLMAWINYINLATAKSINRAKEVGVRKTIGAGRFHLIKQFLTQSLLLNGLAFGLAFVIVSTLQPLFHQLIGKEISFQWQQEPQLIIGLIVICLAGLFLSSAYPAFVLSNFSPQTVFNQKKEKEHIGGAFLRKTLIVFQFAMSILLIAGTLTVFKQLKYLQNKDLGMDISQTLSVRLPSVRDSLTLSRINLFKEELLRSANIDGVAAAHVLPGDEYLWVPSVRKISDNAESNPSQVIYLNAVDPDFIGQFDLEILEGRDFYPEENESSSAMILTETACRSLGIDNNSEALGQQYICMGDTFSIVGVVSDYQQWGFQKAAGDYIFINRPAECRKVAVKVSSSEILSSIELIRNTYNATFPGDVFEYSFLDQQFAKQYQADERFGQLVAIFAGLAIFIACLGLLGLSLFMAMLRRKEIGIRKVLGASLTGIVTLLSKDFLKLVFWAFLIATPLSYYLMDNWLQGFAYRINIPWWSFALAGLVSLVVAFLTMSVQGVKAGLADPVESLRNE